MFFPFADQLAVVQNLPFQFRNPVLSVMLFYLIQFV